MTTDEFPIPALPDDVRVVVLDALLEARLREPGSGRAVDLECYADELLAHVGLGPVEPDLTYPAFQKRGQCPTIHGTPYTLAELDPFQVPLPRNMTLQEQPGHPRPARLILAEIDSPEGRGAIANEDRRRARAASRVISPSRFGTTGHVFVNPPYEGGIADAVKRGIAAHAAAGRGISIGGRAGKTEAAREWRDLAALVTTTHNTPSMLAAARLGFLPRELVELADEIQKRENRVLLENLHRKDSK